MPGPFQFPASGPPSKLIYRSLSDCKQRRRLAFNHEIQVTLPTSSMPSSCPSLTPIIYTVQVPLSSLLSAGFLHDHVLDGAGSFSALSIDSCIDRHNTVAFLPTGHLLITLDRDTYQSLGLTGRTSSLTSNRYDVLVDLNNDFRPGSAHHRRLIWALHDRTDPVQLLVSYVRNGRPASVRFPPDAVVIEVTPTMTTSSIVDPIPIPACLGRSLPETAAAAAQLFDWFGALSCSLSDLLRDPDSEDRYSSRFRLDQLEFGTEKNICCSYRLSGFIPDDIIQEWITFAQNLVESGSVSWAAITVFGFADAPVSWATKDGMSFSWHDYQYEGDGHYLLLIGPGCSIQYMAGGALDECW